MAARVAPRARRGRAGHAPEVLADDLPAEHLLRAAHEQLQEVALRGAQVDRLPGAPHDLLGRVQLHPVEGEHRRRRLPDAPQVGPHPGEQLLHGERLDQVVVRPRVQAGDPVLHRVAGGEHEHRDALPVGTAAQATAEIEAVPAGEHEVEHDQVGTGPGEALGGGVGVAGRLHLVPDPLQRHAQGAAQATVVLHHQHPRAAAVLPLGRRRLTAHHRRRFTARPQHTAPAGNGGAERAARRGRRSRHLIRQCSCYVHALGRGWRLPPPRQVASAAAPSRRPASPGRVCGGSRRGRAPVDTALRDGAHQAVDSMMNPV